MQPSLRAILRCPDCRGELTGDAPLRCRACDVTYPVTDGLPDLLGSTETVNLGEVETQDRVSELYETRKYAREHSRAYHQDSVENMCRLARVEGLVLDNGCGNGFLIEACKKAGATAEFVGIDISTGMLDTARAHADCLVRGDSTRLPFADASFDTVFARSLLHHLPDPEAGMREMARVLKPGGDLIVLDTHKTVISALPRLIANHGEHFDEDHKNFRTSELTALFPPAFEIDRVEYWGYVAYPLLAFPDLFDFSKVLPLQMLTRPLIGLDRFLAGLPGVRRLGWGILVKAHRAGAHAA